MKNTATVDKPLAILTLAIVFASVAGLAIYSTESIALAATMMGWVTRVFTTPVLIFTLLSVVFCLWLAFSKYGHIKFGHEKPEYSTMTWIFMFFLSGMGSATLYWGFLDWAYYYQTPGLNIPAQTPEAFKYSVAYSFFHYGPSAWSIFALTSVPLCYHYYVRKNKGLSLAAIIEAVTGYKATGPVGRLVDLLFLLCMFGALTISLVLTAVTFTNILSLLTGIPNTFTTKVTIILTVSVLFALSSYVGMDSGMKRLSQLVCFGIIAFAVYIFIFGPTEFILNNSLSSLGLMSTRFMDMSLFTDPTGSGQFTRDWTVFYWLWWISYAPGVALFVTRVSRGRSIREVVLALIVAGCAASWSMYGILENFSAHSFLNGLVDVPAILATKGGEVAIGELLNLLPAGTALMWAFLIIMAVYLAAHMDAVGYAVSATCVRNLKEGQDPSPNSRLFWCIMLTLVPIAMIFSKAPLDTMKAATVITALPFIVIILIQTYGLVKWLKQDYGHVPAHKIEQEYMSVRSSTKTSEHEAQHAVSPANVSADKS
ncbi:MAG TPA: BCCT family transporter [Vitreoscilla sp.]|nr:BCCT family transporter [Vitreoscilla sp.]